jgi:hypothetical protein
MEDEEARVSRLEGRLAELEDTLAIYQLMSTYGPAVDGGATEVAADLWTESGDYGSSGAGFWEGSAAIKAMLDAEGHQGLIHNGCAHVFDIPRITISGDRAVALCHFFLYRHGDAGFWTWRVAASRWDLVRVPEGWRVEHRINQLLDGTPEGPAIFSDHLGSPAAD